MSEVLTFDVTVAVLLAIFLLQVLAARSGFRALASASLLVLAVLLALGIYEQRQLAALPGNGQPGFSPDAAMNHVGGMLKLAVVAVLSLVSFSSVWLFARARFRQQAGGRR